ncbi:ABC transporter permease [Meiothermus sp.]|uniref:ABC transporter permease n=1 Tax=Meiothermus sp. TaxID=1955249 RepID=UPI00307E6FDE
MRESRFPIVMLGLALLFLVGPFVVVFISAFSGDRTLAFPPSSFSLQWFAKVLTVEAFQASFVTSLWLGVLSTLLALLMGIPVAYALARYQVPGAEVIRVILTSPLILPALMVGLALLRYFVLIGNNSISIGLLIGHTALLLPYAVRVVSASLANLPRDIEDAAMSLGANRLQTFFRVVLPNIRGGVAAASVLAFITSFNQVPVSLFLTGPGVSTLPIQMLLYMEYTYDPTIAALSTLLILFSILFVLLTERLLGISKYV